jgi:hypothetical protein
LPFPGTVVAALAMPRGKAAPRRDDSACAMTRLDFAGCPFGRHRRANHMGAAPWGMSGLVCDNTLGPSRELAVPDFQLPLSGSVNQSINPFTALFSAFGSQFGVVNVNLGKSSDPAIEAQVLSDVASYGRQLGRIGDVLEVLLTHFRPERALTAKESKAIDDLKRLLADIADVKERNRRLEYLKPRPTE